MDEKGIKSNDISVSSLSDSWNIVDGNDVNNVSEGSDGESIEVIEEECNDNCVEKNTSKLEGKIESKEEPSSKSDDETLVTTSELFTGELPLMQNDIGLFQNITTSNVSGRLKALNIFGIVTVICAIILAGATSWIVLLRFEEIALDTFHYFVPVRFHENSNSNNEFNNLVNQIKVYEAETKHLRSVVADLSNALENLKKELAVSLKFAEKNGRQSSSKKEINQMVNEEDILFQELLNIRIGLYPNRSIFQNEVNSSFEYVAKFVEEIISNLTSGEEQKSNMEVFKLFYQISKHLTILSNFNSTNKNLDIFINSWKERLASVNEKIVKDTRNMQLKMVRHFIKLIKCIQKKFYVKLCNLTGMKKQECYETFIKPYELSEGYSSSDIEDNFDPNNQLRGSEEPDVNKILKDDSDNIIKNQRTGKSPTSSEPAKLNSEKPTENKDKLKKTVPNSKHLNDDELSEDRNLKKFIDQKKLYNQEKTLKDKNNNYESNSNEKGMGNDLKTDPTNNDPINSFSSFSQVQGDKRESQCETDLKSGKEGLGEKKEGGLQKKTEKLGGFPESDVAAEGCWFLKIGSQRSKLRNSEARSNWLFERAKYRSSRNT